MEPGLWFYIEGYIAATGQVLPIQASTNTRSPHIGSDMLCVDWVVGSDDLVHVLA